MRKETLAVFGAPVLFVGIVGAVGYFEAKRPRPATQSDQPVPVSQPSTSSGAPVNAQGVNSVDPAATAAAEERKKAADAAAAKKELADLYAKATSVEARFKAGKAPSAKQTVTVDEARAIEEKLNAFVRADSTNKRAGDEAQALRMIQAELLRPAVQQAMTSTRKAYARLMEENFLRKGMDATVTAEGPQATTLRVRYILISRPLIFKLQEDGSFVSGVRDAGFTKLIMTDGYDKTWSWNFNK